MHDSNICILPNWQLIAVKGEKAADFLQGQVTCDVREVTPTLTRRGAHCNPKGRVLCSFRILQIKGHIYLLAPALMTNIIIDQLKKYAVFSKVVLERDDTYQILGGSGEALTAKFGELPQQPDQMISYTGTEGEIALLHVQGTLPRFEIIGATATINALRQKLATQYSEKTHDWWRWLDIQAGIATIYPQTSDLFTPHMLNYPALAAVSFKKGCYIGQEIIARTQYLGKAKRHLQKLYLASEHLPQPGDAICNQNQENVGVVIDAASQTNDDVHLLAVLQDEAVNADLYWQCADQRLPVGI